MRECSKELRRQGKDYPRTCVVCLLGPCVLEPEQRTALIDTVEQLVKDATSKYVGKEAITERFKQQLIEEVGFLLADLTDRHLECPKLAFKVIQDGSKLTIKPKNLRDVLFMAQLINKRQYDLISPSFSKAVVQSTLFELDESDVLHREHITVIGKE
jgi:hypothetical protein